MGGGYYLPPMVVSAIPSQPSGISRGVVLLLAVACGAIVANLYYAQPLIALIGPSIGLDPSAESFVVTLTQVGYAAGLLLLVPLGDRVENRRLVCFTLGGVIAALVLATLAPNAAVFLIAAALIGISASAVQMLVPIAAGMAPPEVRGRVVGEVMSGLIVGILLARPLASLVADHFSWRTVFAGSAVAMAVLLLVLIRLLPRRQPQGGLSYVSLLISMVGLLRDTPVLRRRAAYQAMMFAAFSLFWTTVPLELMGQFHLSQTGVALFGLAGALGAFAAPVAGRLADAGLTRVSTGVSFVLALAAFGLAWLGLKGSLIALVAAAILLDVAVQCSLVLGQRTIYSLGDAVRSRLNGLFMAIFFLGGAVGSAVASVTFEGGGWGAVCLLGLAFPAAALVLYATEFTRGGARSA